MAALLGIDVDRVISATFVMGAALAAVAGLMVTLYYGVVDFFIGFLAGIKAFTAAVLGGIGSLPGAMLGGLLIGADRGLLVRLFLGRIQGCFGLRRAYPGADFPAERPARTAGSGEGVSAGLLGISRRPPVPWVAIVKDAGLAALVAVLLALPLIGLETYDAGGGALGIRTRFRMGRDRRRCGLRRPDWAAPAVAVRGPRSRRTADLMRTRLAAVARSCDCR